MSKLLRHYNNGMVYFITSVTRRRTPILIDNYDLFNEAINRTQDRVQFEIIAWVVLPDHFHVIIDPRQENLSGIIRRIKLSFAQQYLKYQNVTKGTIWQSRFWDHVIRNQEDMNRHIDYIHYNPVKHDIVKNPSSWKYSSFGKYLEDGYYATDWGVKEKLKFANGYGE